MTDGATGMVRWEPISRRGEAPPNRKQKTTWKIDLTSRVPTIRIENNNIKFKDPVRYLGVRFDEGMGKSRCHYLSDKGVSLQRRMLKSMTSAYRTALSKTLYVVSRPPIDLQLY
uniref:Uncharacterized protein n=1 Tax=Vespula pensylvanica TaxID=30213 RepID=A0A834PFC6_VESPE|nr:hypothetical protein H0235_001080 [Vespula pensylvanica]